MDYIFDEWKSVLEKFQSSVSKDLESIHQQKEEVQQMKTEIFEKLDSGLYHRDENRIIISAPEIILGNVTRSGELMGEEGRVVVKGSEVSLEGVGEAGTIISRAPSIRQLAVNPGIDGLEEVVCDTSEIVSHASDIVIQSDDATDAFSQMPASAGKGGIRIQANTNLHLESAVSSENRKKMIEKTMSALDSQISDLESQMSNQKSEVDKIFSSLKDLYDKDEKLNDEDSLLPRINLEDLEEIHEQVNDMLPMLYHTTMDFIRTISLLAEANRKKTALKTEKDAIKTGDDFKKNSTGASMTIVAESIDVSTADADGNLHTNAEAGINVRTPYMGISMRDEKGTLTKDSRFEVNTQNVEFSTVNPTGEGKEFPCEGNVTILSKNIDLAAVDYQFADKKTKEKQLTADGKVSITAKTVEVGTINPKDIDRDDKGKLTKGTYTAEGDVIIRSKTISMETLDYEVADGKLKTKALTKDSSIKMRSEKINVLAADAEGKATGSISLNAKAVAMKSMDVDKEKLTDSALAAGSTMTLVSEKMYLGAKSKDVKSKKLQAVSQEMGLFADNTFEAQQGDGKAVVQLSGGNASVGGSKTQVYGDTTINAKTEVKGELKAPKVVGDSIEAKSALKSPNISDGMGVGGGGGGGSLSAKLKTEDAPKE